MFLTLCLSFHIKFCISRFYHIYSCACSTHVGLFIRWNSLNIYVDTFVFILLSYSFISTDCSNIFKRNWLRYHLVFMFFDIIIIISVSVSTRYDQKRFMQIFYKAKVKLWFIFIVIISWKKKKLEILTLILVYRHLFELAETNQKFVAVFLLLWKNFLYWIWLFKKMKQMIFKW